MKLVDDDGDGINYFIQNDELCIHNDEFFIKNDEICI